MVTRRSSSGELLGPEQRVSAEEALRIYTLGSAYASFEEKLKGSLQKGKLADFVVIDRDYMKIPAKEIKDIKALLTVVGGEEVFRSPELK